jgi:transcriptional regulator with XRE-family HTH domain
MDKERILRALWRLRKARPELKKDAEFARRSGILPATINQMKHGTLPSVLIQHKWVTTCGITLSKFFSQFEEEYVQREPRIVPGYEDLYADLTAIIETGDEERINGIMINLYYISGGRTPHPSTRKR